MTRFFSWLFTSHGRIVAVLFFLTFFNYVYFKHYVHNANSSTRTSLCLALLDGTVRIDKYRELSIDYAYHDDHCYCDKAPGASFLALLPIAVAYETMKAFGVSDFVSYRPLHLGPGGRDFVNEPNAGFNVLVLIGSIVVSLFCAFGVVLVFLLGEMLGAPRRISVACALLLGFGTTYSVWATVFFSHSLVAALLLCGFVLGLRLLRRPDRGTPGLWTLTGFLLAYAVWTEYTAAVASCLMGVFFLRQAFHEKADRKKLVSITFFLMLGAIPVAAAFFVYNTICFGSPWELAYRYHANFDMRLKSFFALTYPNPVVLLKTLLESHHGVLWYTPIFVLFPFFAARNILLDRHRDMNILALLILSYYFLFNASFSYWIDSNVPVRHVTAGFPFLVIPFLHDWRQNGVPVRVLTVTLLVYSLVVCSTAMMVPIQASYFEERFPLFWHLRNLWTGQGNLLLIAGTGHLVSYLPPLLVGLLGVYGLLKNLSPATNSPDSM